MPYADVNSVRFFCEIQGAGEPVVFIHGYPHDSRTWSRQVAFFAQQFTVVTYDARGSGQSSVPSTGYSMDDYADDLSALLDHLSIPTAYLVGVSFGGAVAIHFALKNPERVAALVLVSSAVAGFKPVIVRSDDDLPGWVRVARTQGVPSALQMLVARPGFQDLKTRSPRVYEAEREMVLQHSGARWLDPAFGRYPPPKDVERLGEIQVPMLVVVGELDQPDYLHLADRLAKEVPAARKVVRGGVGHWAHAEEPTGFNSAVLEFLTRISSEKAVPRRKGASWKRS